MTAIINGDGNKNIIDDKLWSVLRGGVNLIFLGLASLNKGYLAVFSVLVQDVFSSTNFYSNFLCSGVDGPPLFMN